MNKLALIRMFADNVPDNLVSLGELTNSPALPAAGKYMVIVQSLSQSAAELLTEFAESWQNEEGSKPSLTYKSSLYFATDSDDCLIDLLSGILMSDDSDFGKILEDGESLLLLDVYEQADKANDKTVSGNCLEAIAGYYEIKLECLADRNSIYDTYIDQDWLENHYLTPLKSGPIKQFGELLKELDLADDAEDADADDFFDDPDAIVYKA